MWNFTWYTDWDIIFSEKFSQKWHDYFKTAFNANVFNHPSLVCAWIETYKPLRKIKPLFCVANKEDKTIFFPLIVWQKDWKNAFTKLVIPAGYSDFDYTEPLLCGIDISSFEISYFFKELSVQIKKVESSFDALEIPCLRSSLFDSEIFQLTDTACPFISLNNYKHPEDYFQSLSKKLREDIRKRKQKLEQIGNLQFDVVRDKKNAIFYLSEFLQMYKNKRPNAYIPTNLHRLLIEHGADNDLFLMFVCLLDEKVISIRFSFVYKNVVYSYLPVFDEQYADYSIGNIHRYESIEWCIQNNILMFDLLRGKKSYKDKWATDSISLMSYIVIRNTVMAVIKRFFLSCRKLISK